MESIVDTYALAMDQEAALAAELRRARKQIAQDNVAKQALLILAGVASLGIVFAGAAIANLGMAREGVAFCIFGAAVMTLCAVWSQGRGRDE